MRKKIDDFLEKHGKKVVIGSASLVLIALISLYIGFALESGNWGWIFQWLTSKYAIYCYIGIGLFAIITLWLVYYIKNLGDK